MTYTILTLRLLHILFMASWITAIGFLPGDVKRTLLEPKAHRPLLLDRINRYKRLAGASAGGTLLTGFAAIWALGGMGAVARGIHFGLGAGILLFGIGIGVGRITGAIVAGIEADQSGEELTPLVKRLAMTAGMFHLVWLISLTLMVFRHVV